MTLKTKVQYRQAEEINSLLTTFKYVQSKEKINKASTVESLCALVTASLSSQGAILLISLEDSVSRLAQRDLK